MTTTNSTTTQHQLVWPLPATRLSNAHITWAEWVARQAATLSSEQYAAAPVVPAQTLPTEQRSVRYLNRDTETRPVWPLPATQLPHAHLTWAEWVAVQAHGATDQQPEHAASQRAA